MRSCLPEHRHSAVVPVQEQSGLLWESLHELEAPELIRIWKHVSELSACVTASSGIEVIQKQYWLSLVHSLVHSHLRGLKRFCKRIL